MSPELKVGLVGSGLIAGIHVNDYYGGSTDARAQVVAVADARPELAGALAERCGIEAKHTYSSVEDLLASESVDVLDVCTPPSTHPAIMRAGVDAGVAVLCEKPLASDYAEAASVVRFAADQGVAVGVVQNYRWLPEYAAAAGLLASEEIGEVKLALLTSMLHWYGGTPYRMAAERMMFLEMGYHYVDLLQFLIRSEVESVYAEIGRSEAAPNRGDTYGTATLHYANGAVAQLFVSGECPGRVAPWGGRATVQCEHASVYINDPEPRSVYCYGPFVGGGLVQRFAEDRYLPTGQVSFTGPLHDYFGSLIETGRFPVTGAENLHVLATVLACYASAEAHEPVQLSTITTKESIPHG